MSVLTGFIARIGQNTAFVAAMAHIFFAYFVVSLFSGVHQYIAAGVCLLVFGFKEFYLDRLNELNPPQSFWDDLDDFAEYVIGIALAFAAAYFNW